MDIRLAPAEHSVRELSHAAAGVLADPEALGTAALAAACTRFDPAELAGWDPETVALELKDEFGGAPDEGALARLYAALTVLSSDAFYHDAHRFAGLCVVLDGGQLDEGVNFPDAQACAWGITEAVLLNPPEAAQPFGPDVRAFVAGLLDHEGLFDPPAVLRDAAARLPRPEAFPDDPWQESAIRNVAAHRRREIVAHLKARLSLLADQLEPLHKAGGEGVPDLVSDLRRYAAKLSE